MNLPCPDHARNRTVRCEDVATQACGCLALTKRRVRSGCLLRGRVPYAVQQQAPHDAYTRCEGGCTDGPRGKRGTEQRFQPPGRDEPGRDREGQRCDRQHDVLAVAAIAAPGGHVEGQNHGHLDPIRFWPDNPPHGPRHRFPIQFHHTGIWKAGGERCHPNKRLDRLVVLHLKHLR